ncbi:MAG: hypothetical protein RIS68_1368 [Bacteroidota bacterium]|jgi:hypothetical protein
MKKWELNVGAWDALTDQEMMEIHGGNWWTDFKTGFKDGFNWAVDVLRDLGNLISPVTKVNR